MPRGPRPFWNAAFGKDLLRFERSLHLHRQLPYLPYPEAFHALGYRFRTRNWAGVRHSRHV